jgi:hypothetical protein
MGWKLEKKPYLKKLNKMWPSLLGSSGDRSKLKKSCVHEQFWQRNRITQSAPYGFVQNRFVPILNDQKGSFWATNNRVLRSQFFA